MGHLAGESGWGTCDSMCPASEVRFRTTHDLLHRFEMQQCTAKKAGRSKSSLDTSRMVKKYSRPAAGKADVSPRDVRPPPILLITVQHLSSLYASEGASSAYEFVMDRLRAVNQDLLMQRVSGEPAIELASIMAPLYSKMEYDCRSQCMANFDERLHRMQLVECMTSWRGAHDHHYRTDTFHLRLADVTQSLRDHEATCRANIYLDFSHHERKSPLWLAVRDLVDSFLFGNFVRFFKAVRKLVRCGDLRHAVLLLSSDVRYRALKTIRAAYSQGRQQIPVDVLTKWLGFSGPDATRRALKLLEPLNIHTTTSDHAVTFIGGDRPIPDSVNSLSAEQQAALLDFDLTFDGTGAGE